MDPANYYGVIYKITCLVNGKIYIGKTTKTVEIRWKLHCYNKKNNYFQNAIRKYGKENFKIDILCYCYSEIELNDKETELIALFDCRNTKIGYNILPGGEGLGGGENHPWYGKTHSPETKQKLSDLNMGEKNPMFGKPKSEFARKAVSKALTGFVHSESTRKKMSIAKSGKNHHMYGKHHTTESKRKNSESNKGRIVSPETRKKMSDAIKGEKHYNYGKHMPDELKERISKAMSGEKGNNAKLTWKKVEEIRNNEENLSRSKLANKYNVSLSSIDRIINNITWVI